MKYVSISVGAVAGVLAVVLAGVFHKTFIRICVKRGGFNYDRPPGGLYFYFKKRTLLYSLENSNSREL